MSEVEFIQDELRVASNTNHLISIMERMLGLIEDLNERIEYAQRRIDAVEQKAEKGESAYYLTQPIG